MVNPRADSAALVASLPNEPVGETGASLAPSSAAASSCSKGAELRAAARIAAFFGLVIAFLYATHFMVNAGLRRIQTSSFGVWNRILTGQVNADIIISGSSRALTHYDPRIIQEVTGRSCYNIGLNGSQTDMQVARLRAYLRHNRKPSLVIHNLDLFSFQVTHGGVYDPGQYIPYLGEPAIYDALVGINPNITRARYLPLYGYAAEDLRFTWLLGLRGLLGWGPAEDHFSGFVPRDTTWTGDFERFRSQHADGVRIDIEPAGLWQMEALLGLCQEQGIRVLLVYSPEYVEMQKLTSNRAEAISQMLVFAERFEAGFWDYSGHMISASRHFFYNSQHLNARGAEEFTISLARRLLRSENVTAVNTR